MIKKIKNKIKKHIEEVLKIKTSPASIAAGFSVGTFFALFPTLGLELILVPLIILIFKNISKISLALAYLVWNPFVVIFTSTLGYYIGDFIIGDAPIIEYELSFLEQFFVYSRRYLVGNFVLAITLSLLSYYIVFLLAAKYQKKSK